MRCGSAERLLYLHREGDRSPAEQRRLDRHLRNCPSCTAEAHRISESLARIERLKETVLATSDPAAVTESIMTRIRYLEEGARSKTRYRIRLLPGGAFGHRLQPIVVAVALLLAVAILTEGMLILDRITLLESRLQEYAESETAGQSIRTTNDLNRGLRRLRDLEARIGTIPSGETSPDEWIVISRSDLRLLLSRYGGVNASPEMLMRILVRQLPDLRGVTLEDGLNRIELQVLLEHDSEIIRAVREL